MTNQGQLMTRQGYTLENTRKNKKKAHDLTKKHNDMTRINS